MKSKQRRKIIRAMLEEKPFVSLNELFERFPDVCNMTVRRDIDALEASGEAIKVRGGARSMKFLTTTMEDNFGKRLQQNTFEKDSIVRSVLPYLETGRSIFLDSGTTILRLAQIIPDIRLNITTTGPNVALAVAQKTQPLVSLIGGFLSRDNLSVSGLNALKYLNEINIDTAVLVPSGVSTENGFTCGNYSECELKRNVCSKARMVILLMDHTKLNKDLPYTFAGISDVDIIVTDRPLPQKMAEEAERAGVTVVDSSLED